MHTIQIRQILKINRRMTMDVAVQFPLNGDEDEDIAFQAGQKVAEAIDRYLVGYGSVEDSSD